MTSPQIIRNIYTTQTTQYNFFDSLDSVKSIRILNFTYLTPDPQIRIQWYIKDGYDQSIWPYTTFINTSDSPDMIIAAIQNSCSPDWSVDVEYDDDTFTFSITQAIRNINVSRQIINNRIAQTMLETSVGSLSFASDVIRPYIEDPVSEVEANIGATVIRSFDIRGDRIVASPTLDYIAVNTGGITMGLLGTTLYFTGGKSFSLSTTPTVPYPISLADTMAMVNFGSSAMLWSMGDLMQITTSRILFDGNGIVQNASDISPSGSYCLHGNVCYNLQTGVTQVVDSSIANPTRGRISDDPFVVLIGTTNNLYFYNGTSGAFYQSGSTEQYIASGSTMRSYLSPFIGVSKCPYILADNKLFQVGTTMLNDIIISLPIKTVSWTPVALPAPDVNEWVGVCWSPELGIFCSIASLNDISNTIISYDGINWVKSTSDVGLTSWVTICWSSELGIFCAVTFGGINRSLTSSDGVTWTSSGIGVDANNWRSICWSAELGIFCAVASTGTKRTMTSSDGVTWVSSGTGVDANSWYGICWSPELGKFCAVATLGTNRTMTSSDGITWVSSGRGVDTSSWRDICWSAELGIFCAIASIGTNRSMTSSDGIIWVSSGNGITANSWFGICWSPELGIFSAVASGTNRSMTSSDGINWIIYNNTIVASWYKICWSPQLKIFCSVGDTHTITTTTSDDYQSTRLGGDGSVYTGITYNFNKYILRDNKIETNTTNFMYTMSSHANTTWSLLYTLPTVAITNSFFINLYKLNEHAPPAERYSSGTTYTSIIHLAQCNSNSGMILYNSPYEQETSIANLYKVAFNFSYEDGQLVDISRPYVITFEVIRYIYRLEDAHISSRSNISHWLDYAKLFDL